MAAEHPYVAIIGAGLGGLCLAQGLRKRGVPFGVFERDHSACNRGQGYRIRIDRQGREALRECLPDASYALFRATSALPVSGINVFNSRLEDITNRWVASWQRSGDSPPGNDDDSDDLRVHRLTLREVLMSGIEKQLHFGKAFSHYEERDEEVIAHFSDGSALAADVLVGADGIHSKVRRQFLPAHEPLDTRSVCIYGQGRPGLEIPASTKEHFMARTSIIFADGVSVIIDPMRFRATSFDASGSSSGLSRVDDYLYWAIIGTRAAFGLSAEPLPFGEQALVTLIDDVTRSWSPAVKTLFKQGETSSMAMVAVRAATPSPPWKPGRVTVLGDAIHAMSPAGGLGANTALRDAAMLAACLDSSPAGKGSVPQAIGEYEAAMRSYGTLAIQASENGSRVLFGQSHDA